MRSYVRSVVDIDTADISDDTLNRFLGEGYDVIVYSEKRWPFFEVATTFNTVATQKDYTLAAVGALVTLGLREIAALRTDAHVISFVGRDAGDVVYPLNLAGSGSPWWWSYWGETVRLYPTPQGVENSECSWIQEPDGFRGWCIRFDGTNGSTRSVPHCSSNVRDRSCLRAAGRSDDGGTVFSDIQPGTRQSESPLRRHAGTSASHAEW